MRNRPHKVSTSSISRKSLRHFGYDYDALGNGRVGENDVLG